MESICTILGAVVIGYMVIKIVDFVFDWFCRRG